MARVPAVEAWSPPYLRPVLFLVGGMLVALAAAMLLPAAVDLYAGNRDWQAFAFSSGVTLACGGGLLYANRCRLQSGLTLRQAFVLIRFPCDQAGLIGFGHPWKSTLPL